MPRRHTLAAGLRAIEADVRAGTVEWDPALEDIHLNVEMALARTGRARGRQAPHRPLAQRPGRHGPAALAEAAGSRTWTPRCSGWSVRSSGWRCAHRSAVMPGHTHVQPAQPVLFAHHLLAYVEMLERDRGPLRGCASARADVSPLGSGAIAGAGFALDREAVAAELGFERRDAQLDRRRRRPRLRRRERSPPPHSA